MLSKSKITPCTNCRQMKLRCDTQKRFPQPCSRCAKQKLSCSINPSFKREAKRKRILALEREIQDIKANARISPCPPGPSEQAEGELLPSSQLSIPLMDSLASDTLSITSWTGLSDNIQNQILDDVEVEPDAIRSLIGGYYTNCHLHFPILPDIAIFAKNYNTCPLLFWTIIAIGSKYSSEYATVYLRLSISIPRLIGDLNVSAKNTLGHIQALLILCWWPFPFQATINDPSWTYSGLATHRALQFGIHRVRYHSDFFYNSCLENEEFNGRKRTWIGCYIIDQILSSHLGIPSTIQPEYTIIDALSEPSVLPDVLIHHLKIAYHSHKICQTLGNYALSSTGLHPAPLALIPVFESQMQILEAQLSSSWSDFTKVAYWRTEIQLCSFALPTTASFPNCEKPTLDIESSAVLVRGCIAAISLIHTATSSPDSYAAWINLLRISVGYAAFFLLKTFSMPELNIVNPISAQNSISSAWAFLHRGSEMGADHFTRVCAIIEYLSKRGGSRMDAGGEMTLNVQSRMSANVMWDAAWRAKERFSQSVKDAEPEDYTEAEAVEKLLQSDLEFLMAPYIMEQINSEWDFLV